jgi:uncharacterized protein YegP (UPF0339 family)
MAKEPWFDLYQDARGEWRWTLYAANGEKIADSAEGYVERRKCLHGLGLVRTWAATARVQQPPLALGLRHINA